MEDTENKKRKDLNNSLKIDLQFKVHLNHYKNKMVKSNNTVKAKAKMLKRQLNQEILDVDGEFRESFLNYIKKRNAHQKNE